MRVEGQCKPPLFKKAGFLEAANLSDGMLRWQAQGFHLIVAKPNKKIIYSNKLDTELSSLIRRIASAISGAIVNCLML